MKRILIVKLSSLGDLLHFFPALTWLHQLQPDATIDWVVEPAFADLVSWHQAVNQVISAPIRQHKKHWWRLPSVLGALKQELNQHSYDLVIDSQGLLKSAWVARLAGAPVAGYGKDSARESLAARCYQRPITVTSGQHIVRKHLALIGGIFDVEVPDHMPQQTDFGLTPFIQQQHQTPLSAELSLLTDLPFWVMLHGTTWNTKYWPEAHWQSLIQQMISRGQRVLLPWGNEAEYQRAYRLKADYSDLQCVVLPRLSLNTLAALMLKAKGVVSAETGLGHIATVLGVPCVMLHGPTDPLYSGIQLPNCHHLSSRLTCAPCLKRDCPKNPVIADQPDCQLQLKPQYVMQFCEELI